MSSFLLIVLSLLSIIGGPIKIMELPDGELAWTAEGPKNAKMCVPAAFTDLEGNVEGEYRLNGVIHNPNKRLKVFPSARIYSMSIGSGILTLVSSN